MGYREKTAVENHANASSAEATAQPADAHQLELQFPEPLPSVGEVWDGTAHLPGVRPAADLYRKHLEDLGKEPEPLKARLNARNEVVRLGARLDLHLLRLLGLSVGDDGIATADERFLAKHLGRARPQVRKRITRLVREGSLRLHRKGSSHTAAAYVIVNFEAYLKRSGKAKRSVSVGDTKEGQGGIPKRPRGDTEGNTEGDTKGDTKEAALTEARARGSDLQSSEFIKSKRPDCVSHGSERTGARPRSAPSTARPAAAEDSLYAGRDRVESAPHGLTSKPPHWHWAEWNRYGYSEEEHREDQARNRRSELANAELARRWADPQS